MSLHRLAIVALCTGFLIAAGCGDDEDPGWANEPGQAEMDETDDMDEMEEPDAPSASGSVANTDAMAHVPPLEEVDEALRGFVSTTALYVRSGPGTANPVVGVLVQNDPVTITDTQELARSTWWRVEAAGGYVDGWVSAKFMEHGDPPRSAHAEVGYGEQRTPTLVTGPFQYVGVSVCQECHVDSTGAHPRGAYPIWKGHLHSEAFESLSRDYTLEIARRVRGVEDPTTDWRCVKCHVTAYGAAPEQLAPTYKDSDGVGCEVCHGPGSEYADADHGAGNPDRYALGFMKLTNLEEREDLCVSCHNEASPTYKPFNVMAFSREIRHWPDPDDAAYFARAEAKAEQRARETPPEPAPAEPSRAKQEAAEVQRKQAEAAARGAEQAKQEAERRAAAAAAAAAADAGAADAAAEARRAEAKKAEEAAARARAEAEKKEAAKKEAAKLEAEALAQKEGDQARAAEDQAARAAKEAKERAAAEAAAKAALEEKKAEEAKQRERQQKLAQETKKKAQSGSPLDRFLEDVPDEIKLNKDGVKRDVVRFTHGAHSSADYVAGVKCQTCHHTQEGEEKPEPCSACHDPGGDAGEEKLKSKASHNKSLGFPLKGDQEQVSCVGCHKSQNAALAAGKRTGEKAPTKCAGCHDKKGS